MTWVAVGTAAAVGAGVGAGSAAIQGKSGDEILTGALIGGATGAVTGGAGAAASGLTTTAGTVGTELGKEVAKEAVTEVGKEAVKEGATQVVQEGIKEGATQTLAEAAPQAIQEAALNPEGILQANSALMPPAGSTPLPPAGIEQAGFSPAEMNAINQGQADALASGPSPYAPTASTGQTPLVPANAPTPAPSSAPAYGDFPGSASDPTAGMSNPAATPSAPKPETNAFLQGAKDVGSWMDSNPFKTGAAAYVGLQATGAFDQKGADMPQKKTYKNQYSLSPDFQGGPYSEPNVYKPNYSNYAAGGIAQINGPVEQMSANALGGNANMYPQSQQERTNFATPTQMPASAEVTMDNQYQGVTMAQGGIARFSGGEEVEERPTRRYRGDLTGTLDKYSEMIEGKKSGNLPTGKSDPYTGEVGTFTDNDADTRLQDAYTASLTRLKKTGKRANYDVAAAPTGIQAGALNMPTRQAAGGGIMQASLGGYAAGGNPRLLSGPGDGMSDNIPATISGRQPARLADGEFVVPADVVSHLGNGSTNAGAKKLHGMMDKVRMDRTGKKKQAPAVKAGKYMPK